MSEQQTGDSPGHDPQADLRAAVEDGLDEAHRYLKRQWRERPVAVAATAFGLGLFLGMLMSGRR